MSSSVPVSTHVHMHDSNSDQLNEAILSAMELWTTKVQLSSLLQSMQMNVTDTWRTQKEQSLQTRKALAETTKQFKKSVKTAEQAVIQMKTGGDPSSPSSPSSQTNPATDLVVTAMDALSNECRSTVKLYQEEIDSLTRRCKSVEQEYSAIYARIVDVPDPSFIFSHCTDVIASQSQQMNQLLATVDSLNRELQQSDKLNEEYKAKNQELLQSKNAASSGNNKMSNEEREELVDLRKEVAEYEMEFRSLKNQDITIRRLEEKINQLQIDAEETVRTSVESAKEEIAKSEEKRITELLERENMLQVKIQTLELQLRSERTSYEISQQNLSKVDDHITNQQTIWDVQRNILMDDNTRVREQLQSLTRERDDLVNEVSVYRNTGVDNPDGTTSTMLPRPPSSVGFSPDRGSTADLLLERNAYEAEVSELSEANVVLREELRQKDDVAVHEKRTLQSKIDALEREKSSLQGSISSLEMQLSSAPSRSAIEGMKRELRILKRLEYNAEENNDGDDDDDIDTDRDPELTAGGSSSNNIIADENDLETILVNKLRHVEKELIMERNTRTESNERIETLTQELFKMEQAKTECEQLIVALENDLQRAVTQVTPAITMSKHKSDMVQLPTDARTNSATLQHILDPSAPPPPPTSSPAASKATSEKADDDHSVATIIMAQRDRLRVRCDALEAERDSFKRELQYQVQTLESLKSDNTKLYEKVRYLQNYTNKGNAAGSGSSSKSGGLNQRTVGLGDRDLDLEALEQRYEASVDPFKQFSKSERQRKLNEMSPMERTVFVVAKTVLSTKEMRTGLFFYVVTLHLLVFATTYNWSHGGTGCDYYSTSEYLAHLPPTLPKHLQEKQLTTKNVLSKTDPIKPA